MNSPSNPQENANTRPRPTPSTRLRAKQQNVPFHVVLVTPEIPPNTGNIGRLCAATGARLHLVEPLGFRIDEQAVRRAGLDYWPLVDLKTHSDFDAAVKYISEQDPSANFWFFSGKTERSYLQATFTPGDVLVFGRESSGLPDQLLKREHKRVLGIPTLGAVRSLNLSNAVAITLYEALRQTGELAQTSLRQ